MQVINITLWQWARVRGRGLFIQEHHVIALRLFLNLLPEATRQKPALPKVEPCMQNRKIWLLLFSHTALIACADSSFTLHVCVCLLQRVCYSFPTSCCSTLLMLSTASPPLSTPPTSACSTVSGCVGETSWALQCMLDQKEDKSGWIAPMWAL